MAGERARAVRRRGPSGRPRDARTQTKNPKHALRGTRARYARAAPPASQLDRAASLAFGPDSRIVKARREREELIGGETLARLKSEETTCDKQEDTRNAADGPPQANMKQIQDWPLEGAHASDT